MAQQIEITVYGINGRAVTGSPITKSINVNVIQSITEETYSVTDAVSTVYVFQAGYAGGATMSYQVSEAFADLVTASNTDTTPSLDVLDDLTVGGYTETAKTIIESHTNVAVNTTATVTGANLKDAYFTSTSAAPVTLTLPTATDAATALGATRGTVIDFFVDNTAGASTVTVAVNTGIVVQSVVTGGETLTVAASATEGVGCFRLVFSSATTAVLSRLA